MNTKLAALALAGLLAAGTMSVAAHAAGIGETREATALMGAKTTLSQAIATAQRQTGGTAFDAGVDLSSQKTRIAVETNGPKGVQTTFVDADSGRIVGGHPGVQPD